MAAETSKGLIWGVKGLIWGVKGLIWGVKHPAQGPNHHRPFGVLRPLFGGLGSPLGTPSEGLFGGCTS